MDDCTAEGVDPRVKDQLEFLNSYTDEINSLELQLDDANATFRNTLSEYSQRLKQLAKKLGKCVEVARPYYEAEEVARKAKLECEEAAVKYHRACGIHKEARETISVAEQKFNAKKDDWEFDAAWQEMLNRETIKVMNAESMKEESEKEHEKKTRMFAAAVQKVKLLENQLKRDIVKSRPYFEQKAVFLKVLQDLKSRVESLQNAVMDSKASYANCLHNLEMISKEIHERRKLLLQPREPGVGAEQDHKPTLDFSIFPPLGSLQHSDTASIFADSISSAANSDTMDDLEDCCLKSSSFVPTLNLPLLEVTSRQVSSAESNLYIPAHVKESPEATDVTKSSTNVNMSGDYFVQESTTEQHQPSTQSPVCCSDDDDTFEEVDLSHD